MRIALVTLGSRGDVQPFVALGTGLRARGHEVTLVSSDDFQPLAEEAGLGFRTLLGGRPEDVLTDPRFVAELRAGRSAARVRQAMPKPTVEQRERTLREVQTAVAGADLAVYTPHTRAAALISDVPWCSASLWPVTPTAALPAFGFPALKLGGAYHRFTYRVMAHGEWQFFRPAVNRERAERGLRSLGAAPPRDRHAHRPVLYPFSRVAFPPPPDWPAHAHVTGAWFWDRARRPPAELLAFLDDGPEPILATFGTAWVIDPERTLAALLHAARRFGRRVVLVDGPETSLPDDLVRVHDVDYGEVFARVAAVVHHGGQGTTAAALRAGVPQVVVPSFADQPFWGRRMAELGVAAAPVGFPELTGERLAAALGTALDGRTRERAAGLGQQVRDERGVGAACDVLEQWLARNPSEERTPTR